MSNLIKKIMGIPAEQNLVWGMIGKQGNMRSQIFAFLAFFGLLYLGYQSPWGPIAFIMAMYLHEWGHWLIFKINGIVAKVWLLFPFGAVAAPRDDAEDKRSDQLPWWNIGWFLQAGPTTNVALMLVGHFMLSVGFLPALASEMIFINGLLAAFNFLPLGNMDGGQFFHVIYSSLEEKYDRVVAAFGLLVCLVILGSIFYSTLSQTAIMLYITLYRKSGMIIFLALMAAGVWHKQGKDNPLHSQSSQAMTVQQVAIQLIFYTGMVLLSVVLL